MTTIDIIVPDGSSGSLTAILPNITDGVNIGMNDIQKAAAESGFFASAIIIIKPKNKVKITGVISWEPSSSVFTMAPIPANKLEKKMNPIKKKSIMKPKTVGEKLI